jgi:hypothetical protein
VGPMDQVGRAALQVPRARRVKRVLPGRPYVSVRHAQIDYGPQENCRVWRTTGFRRGTAAAPKYCSALSIIKSRIISPLIARAAGAPLDDLSVGGVQIWYQRRHRR